MTTTQINYGKIITSVQEDTTKSMTTVKSFKVSQLSDHISNLECFAIRLSKTVLKKTINKIEALGFDVEIDEDYGFDWEVKMYCNK